MEAQKLALAGILGDDIKHVISAVGYDLTGVTITFELSAGAEQPAIVTAEVDLLDVIEDEDGVSTSIVEVFASATSVRAAVAGVGGLPGNEPLTLFYQIKFNRLPGDPGSDAVTTILFGDYVMKGEVNG
ncbi:hypothetical protein GR702_17530 [Novosphingobium sp. FGD1]|uniref:Uncharacterized protein n=1 Tax=Novosphingobium silvae TaxID=2692619 RepID=A0A7X4GJ30_9SPHN|nr:hypothetical protein [Novosphingobium silvae]MYL99566.1 hypothetical protein [Novosphingobium silvae]